MPLVGFWLRAGLLAFAGAVPGCESVKTPESCPDSGQNRPTALEVDKPGYNSLSAGARALDVNSSGVVVGIEDGDYRIGMPPYGFSKAPGASEFAELTHAGGAFLPQALNDSGLIAGFTSPGDLKSALDSWPVLGSWPFSGPRPEPIAAAMMRLDGGGFMSLHPDGLEYSKATAISTGGLVGGVYSPDGPDSMHACLFNYPGVGLVDLHVPGVARSEVIDLNDAWILLRAYPSDQGVAYLVRVGEPWTRVKAPGSTEVRLTGINDRNLVSGYQNRSAFQLEGRGMSFSADDMAITYLPDSLRLGEFLYADIRPRAANRHGVMVGIAYRGIPGDIPQARAFSWDPATGMFRDISPADAYAEAYQINDDGMVAGYSGFIDGRCRVYNRAILTEATAGTSLE